MTPALQYAQITKDVAEIVFRYDGNDKSRAAYLVMRAALLHIRAEQGPQAASRKAVQLADEMNAT